MFQALDIVELEELQQRWDRARRLLAQNVPQADGLLVLSRINTYWCSGHLANGMLWLPLEGEPILLVRKGLERARMESPLQRIYPCRSFSELPTVLSEAGLPPVECAAVESSGLSWAAGPKLEEKLQGWRLLDGDPVLSRVRSIKTSLEIQKMRLAGERQQRCLERDLSQLIRPGMSEREIAFTVWQEYFRLGSLGMVRMSAAGEELLLGHISAGDSGNYPATINTPLGVRGQHPAAPCMGYAGKVWQRGEILTLDPVFLLEGYHTDKTQSFFAGEISEVDPEIRSAHSFCLEVQQSAAEMLKPGITPAEIYEHCFAEARRHGFEEGFMGLGDNRVPFVGHGIGLCLDEYPPLAKKFTEPLEEDMVLALEPKMGLPGKGMPGVENTFRVTAQGGESLTGESRELICL
jgi:Xaa-Pro aminopeptidase